MMRTTIPSRRSRCPATCQRRCATAKRPDRASPVQLPDQFLERRRRAGPKGQLAQYRWFKQMEYQEKLAARAEREAAMLRVAQGAVRPPDLVTEEGENDEDFLNRYRRQRLRELQVEATRPTFGSLRREVSKDDYLAAIDLDPRIVVVVHLTDPSLPPCRRLEALLDGLARRRPEILFISMTLHEAGQQFDSEVMPVLAFYQAGLVVDTLFQVTAELDIHAEHDDLEYLVDATAPFQRGVPVDIPADDAGSDSLDDDVG